MFLFDMQSDRIYTIPHEDNMTEKTFIEECPDCNSAKITLLKFGKS